MRTIQLPAAIADLDLPLVVSVSGGKDSTACMIALRAAGLPFRAVFADTGWEAPETYAYLDTLRSIFGPIDVYRAHHEAGVPLNPLYKRGHTRVGCWPCIHANKQEIRLLAEHDPARVDEVAELEAWTEDERRRRNAETPGRYKHPRGSLLQASSADGVAPIRDVVAWSRTSRGGRQLPLLVDPPSDGCFRWGLCEVAKRGGE